VRGDVGHCHIAISERHSKRVRMEINKLKNRPRVKKTETLTGRKRYYLKKGFHRLSFKAERIALTKNGKTTPRSIKVLEGCRQHDESVRNSVLLVPKRRRKEKRTSSINGRKKHPPARQPEKKKTGEPSRGWSWRSPL